MLSSDCRAKKTEQSKRMIQLDKKISAPGNEIFLGALFVTNGY